SERAADQGLQREQPKLFVAAVGQIFLVPGELDVGLEVLDATRAAPAATLGLDEIRAHLAAADAEGRIDVAFGVELVVMIFGNAAAEFERLEEAADGHVDPGVGAGLTAVERRRFGLLAGIERVADRHAVAEGVMADRNADVEVAVDISDAAGHVSSAASGV